MISDEGGNVIKAQHNVFLTYSRLLPSGQTACAQSTRVRIVHNSAYNCHPRITLLFYG
jgi:hypothetical protein